MVKNDHVIKDPNEVAKLFKNKSVKEIQGILQKAFDDDAKKKQKEKPKK